MRIGATLLFKNELCYQSYDWQLQRPLGGLQHAIHSLEEYEVDEIAIIRPIRGDEPQADYLKDLKSIESIKTMTPLSFGGGIRDTSCLEAVSALPIERLIFSSAFFSQNLELIDAAIHMFGHQAIIGLIPFQCTKSEVRYFHCSGNRYSDLDLGVVDQYTNEIILYDCGNEGHRGRFALEVLKHAPIENSKIILSGGVDMNIAKQAYDDCCAAVHIENRVLHTEYSIQGYRHH